MTLRVAQISKSDVFGGGASKVAAQINQLLNENGVFSVHLASWAGAGYSGSLKALYPGKGRVIRALHSIQKKMGFPELIPFELPYLMFQLRKHKIDTLHFHDLSSAISPVTVYILSRFYKVFWTIHDCSAFTGGCLYPMGCGRVGECGECPQIGQWPIDTLRDRTKFSRALKKRLYKGGSINFITPSDWMSGFAYGSGMLDSRPSVILNGVNVDLYEPGAGNEISRFDSIKSYSGIKILLSAGDLGDVRKGISEAIQVLNGVKHLDPLVVLVGNKNNALDEALSGFNRIYLGYVSNEALMAAALTAVDVFLFCSLADNLPLSMLESLACGTPVVGFSTGGMPEVVINGVNGFLSDGNIVALSAELERLALDEMKLKEMKSASRRLSLQYGFSGWIDKHIEMYKGS